MAAQDGGPPAFTMPLELSDEERAVLRECRVNSIYFRGLPLGTVSVLLMRELIKWGYVPKAKRFAGLYYTGLFTLGFFAGVGSYRKTCMEKIMRLENSNLANQVRDFYQRAGMQVSGPGAEQSLSTTDEFGEHSTVFDDVKEQPSSERRGHTEASPGGSRDAPWPSPLGLHGNEEKPSDKYTSYEDLRRRNRNQWMTPQQPSRVHPSQNKPSGEDQSLRLEAAEYHSPADNYSDESTASSWTSDDNKREPATSEEKSLPPQRWQRPLKTGPPPKKNLYGDEME